MMFLLLTRQVLDHHRLPDMSSKWQNDTMIAPQWLTTTEQSAWRSYRRMQRLLNAELAKDLAEDGLSEADYDVLSDLSEADGHRYRISDLAERLRWSSSRISHHLSRMEKRGLVKRQASPEDGRGAYVVLTKAGLSTIEAAAPQHVASVRRNFIDHLSAGELKALETIADKIADPLETE
jgi:DNA-binding MarR family transcriptional regulator